MFLPYYIWNLNSVTGLGDYKFPQECKIVSVLFVSNTIFPGGTLFTYTVY